MRHLAIFLVLGLAGCDPAKPVASTMCPDWDALNSAVGLKSGMDWFIEYHTTQEKVAEQFARIADQRAWSETIEDRCLKWAWNDNSNIAERMTNRALKNLNDHSKEREDREEKNRYDREWRHIKEIELSIQAPPQAAPR